MPTERDNDAERRERLKLVLQEAQDLRKRAHAAGKRAQELISHSRELFDREDRRQQRERLLKQATESLKAAKVPDPRPVLLRFQERRRKKKTG
jgi:hypothetical protein